MEEYLKNYPHILNVNEVAEILSITPKTVHQALHIFPFLIL